MATMNVSLPEQMKTWVEAQTKEGRFSNSSDYVRDLIRRDRARQEALLEVQSLIDEGLESGEPRAFDFSGFIARKSAGSL